MDNQTEVDGRGRNADRSVAFMVTSVFFYFVWFPASIFAGRVPGDIGDGRFNLYVLEHVTNWSKGNAELFSPEIFWPLQNTALFSELYLGSFYFYSVPRYLGFGMLESFTIWFYSGLLLSFFAAYIVAQRLGFNRAYSALVGVVFTCSIPAVALTSGHAQLVHRWYVPFALWAVIAPEEYFPNVCKRVTYFLTTISIGLLLSPNLAVLVLVYCCLLGIAMKGLPYLYGNEKKLLLHSGGSYLLFSSRAFAKFRKGIPAAQFVLMALSLYLMYRYWDNAKTFGITRGSDEILRYSPDLNSLLVGHGSRLWGWLPRVIGAQANNEQTLFFGISLTTLAVLGATIAKNKKDIIGQSLAFATVSALMLLIKVESFSFFAFVAPYMPGLSSIRTPGRMVVIFSFVVGILVAIALRELREKRTGRTVAAAVLILMLFSDMVFQAPKSSETVWLDKPFEISTEFLALKDVDTYDAFLLLDTEGQTWWHTDLDAMLASQIIEIPTVNGYSGFTPFERIWREDCNAASTWIEGMEMLKQSNILILGSNCSNDSPG
jgi:hypothetical protein